MSGLANTGYHGVLINRILAIESWFTLTDQTNLSLTMWIRLIARTLIILWAGIIVFGGFYTIAETEAANDIILFHILIPIFTVVITWYFEGIGGILQIVYGFYGWLIIIFREATPVGIMLFTGPFLIGILFLTCWYRSVILSRS